MSKYLLAKDVTSDDFLKKNVKKGHMTTLRQEGELTIERLIVTHFVVRNKNIALSTGGRACYFYTFWFCLSRVNTRDTNCDKCHNYK